MARPLPNQTALNVAQAFFRCVIRRFLLPHLVTKWAKIANGHMSIVALFLDVGVECMEGVGVSCYYLFFFIISIKSPFVFFASADWPVGHSVTRFGEILKVFGNIYKVYLIFWQNCEHYFGNFLSYWAKVSC